MKRSFLWTALAGVIALLAGCSKSGTEIEPTPEPKDEKVAITSLNISPATVSLKVGETAVLYTVIKPSNATDKTVTWSSNKTEVATVNSYGTVTAISAGTAVITAKANSGDKSATSIITVINPEVPTVEVTKITVSPTSVSLKVGETAVLEAVIEPSDATYKTVSWVSDKTDVATVDESGKVTALAAGSAVITATAVGGKTAASTITVTSPDSPPASDRWQDTGADVPAYPTYNKVSTLPNFPRIDITTDDGRAITSKTTYKSGKVTFKDPAKMYSDVTSLGALTMQIKGRGNTTWNAEGGIKNPYRMKLNEHNKVFGMKGDKDWILLADVQDPTLLRNAVALRIARLVSMPWTPKYRAAEVYINGSYAGCYLIVEAKEADRENKVPVTPVTGSQTDGGYYMEIDDKSDDDQYFWSSTFGKKIKYKEPEAPTSAQKKFIEDYINDVEKLLQQQKFDKTTGYWSKMEVSTFINQYIVQELTMNVDGNMRLSTYFAKDTDTKLFMPMVWDFDLALGNCTYLGKDFNLPYYDGSRDGPKGWFIKIRGGYPGENYGQKDTYYQYMFKDPQFVSELKARWNQVKSRLDKIPDFIDKMSEYNSLAYDHNRSGGKNPRANRSYTSAPDAFTSWTAARDWLKDWYKTRLSWLDTEINKL
ncbi:MAG: CotH kinase family protein [Bacteroidales bacterium]|nr:CotH kinase family protein [Bacteroidales bacterium]